MFGFLKSKKPKHRTISGELVCLYHEHSDPTWFTEENADLIPWCTSCGTHLIPPQLKDVLVTGDAASGANLDNASAVVAICTGTVMLWAHLNQIGKAIPIESVATVDPFADIDHPEWPNLNPSTFEHYFGTAQEFGSDRFGDLLDVRMYLGIVSNLLTWNFIERDSVQILQLWPKASIAAIHEGNLVATTAFLDSLRNIIPGHPIWRFFDRIIDLLSTETQGAEAYRLIPYEIEVQSICVAPLIQADLIPNPDPQTSELLTLSPYKWFDHLASNSARRFHPKPGSAATFIGPFNVEVRTLNHTMDETTRQLKLVQETRFSLLIRAQDEKVAEYLISHELFESFGFRVMHRPDQRWLLSQELGIEWDIYPYGAEPWHQSKITKSSRIGSEPWEGTPWQSQCM